MKIKEGASLAGLHEKMRIVMINAEAIWAAHNQELVITSGLDGTHSPGSLHYCGQAVDMRTSYFTDREATACATTLRTILGDEYFVLNHPHRYADNGDLIPGHIHADYRGE